MNEILLHCESSNNTLPPGFEIPIYNYKDIKQKTILQTIENTIEKTIENTTTNIHKNKGYPRRRNVLCANCGGMGHIYKNCNHPIISYGVICFKLCIDKETLGKSPRYLMVQRKDSLSYVEFIRGKYNIKSKSYIMEMFSMMTNEEREGISTKTFENLWQSMWCKNIHDEGKTFSKEFKEAYDKFQLLKKGYHIKSENDLQFFNIDYILDNTISLFNETEWGFPKGRRNINENDINCALREFKEETGIPQKVIQLCSSYIKPLEEVFSGTNKIRYKHVYYIARINADNQYANDITIDPENKQQCKEIRNIKWFTYEEAQSKIRSKNIERKELLKRLHLLITKHIYS
jgi:8-oxo-dGTP pyrophosphatase MutT (NUDIX family)